MKLPPASADLTNLARLLRRIRRYAEKKGLKAQAIQDLELAAEEILVNISRYAYPGRSGEIRVSCRFRTGAVEVGISDRGRPFDPTTFPDPDVTIPVEHRPEGGMGIYIARHHVDGFHYRRGRGMNRVTLVKKKEQHSTGVTERLNAVYGDQSSAVEPDIARAQLASLSEEEWE